MQDPHVTHFIYEQPAALQSSLQALRELILQAAPNIAEEIKYDIPFYTYYRPLCYLNVRHGTVLWGFCQGTQLSNSQGLLVGNGKQVRHVPLRCLADIDHVGLQALLQEALCLNALRTSAPNP